MIVMSPSNIINHRKCPLQAWAMREKLILWKETPQKQRGIDLHEAMEQAVKNGFTVPALPSGCNAVYVTDVVQKLGRSVHEHPVNVLTEQDLAVTRDFKATTFFANDVFFRCRADLLILSKDRTFAMVGDWKTGKVYSYSEDQMRLEALLVFAIYRIPLIHWRLYYVDQGQTKKGSVNFANGLAPVQDLIADMREMQKLSESNGPWVAKQNTFCRWCDWYHNKCAESVKW